MQFSLTSRKYQPNKQQCRLIKSDIKKDSYCYNPPRDKLYYKFALFFIFLFLSKKHKLLIYVSIYIRYKLNTITYIKKLLSLGQVIANLHSILYVFLKYCHQLEKTYTNLKFNFPILTRSNCFVHQASIIKFLYCINSFSMYFCVNLDFLCCR